MSGDSPIVAEVRERARIISARYGDDIDRYCEHLREMEKQYAHGLVSQITVVPARNAKPSPNGDANPPSESK
jgi:hypothetical protein